MDAWLALMGLSLGVIGAWSTVRRVPMPRQEPALTIALTVAALESARRGHGPVTPAHLAHAAIFALEREDGPDLSLLREALEAHIDTFPVAHDDAVSPAKVPTEEAPLGREVMRAIHAAATSADREGRTLALCDVLERLRGDMHVHRLLEATSGPPPSRPSALLGAPYRAVSGSERIGIRLVNDDVSTMEGVLAVLRECFAKGNAEALHLMLTTHYEGSALVGSYPRAEAQLLRDRAVARARSMGMPLAIEIDAPDAPASRARSGFAARLRELLTPRPFP